jgi:hypothetical protein
MKDERTLGVCGMTINLNLSSQFSSLHFEIMRKFEIYLFALEFHCIALEYIECRQGLGFTFSYGLIT